jgi:RNA polymerase sigma-70 factor, ECF subfamily
MSNADDRSLTRPPHDHSFDAVVVPHLEAARRLARWLVGNEQDAEDAVQEASLRAFRYFRTFVGGSGRAWFLQIVRNACYGRRGPGIQPPTDPFDEEQHSGAQRPLDPETLLLQTDDAALIQRAMTRLPDRSHELLVLRELEGLSYQEVADVMGIPRGTVMSRLSRARHAFRRALNDELQRPGPRRIRPGERQEEALFVM